MTSRAACRFGVTVTVRDSWAQWLGQAPWDLYPTLTDPGYPHPETMSKRFRYLTAKMNDHLYGRRWREKGLGVEYVVGLERQRRGSCHAHGLIRFPDHDVRDPEQLSLRYWQRFASDLGGWCWLEIPSDSAAVTAYVTKYVLKDGELELSPNLNPWHPRTYGTSLLGGG